MSLNKVLNTYSDDEFLRWTPASIDAMVREIIYNLYEVTDEKAAEWVEVWEASPCCLANECLWHFVGS
jgi:hypothetical protein